MFISIYFYSKSGQIPAMLVDTATKNQEWKTEQKLSDKKNEKKKSEKKNENENLNEKKEISIDDIIDNDDVKDEISTNTKPAVEKPIALGGVEKVIESAENKIVQGIYIYVDIYIYMYMNICKSVEKRIECVVE
jgi:flagellar biosynthesis component FlhA